MVDNGERMRMSAGPAGRAGRRRGRVLLPTVATLLAVALGASGCAATAAAPAADPASEELGASLAEWWSADEAGRQELLDADSRELGALLLEASGLADQLGVDPHALEAQFPRFAMPERPADAVEPAAEAPADPAPAEPPPLPDDPFDGVDMGPLEGMTPEEIAALSPEELAAILAGGGASGGGAGGVAGPPAASDSVVSPPAALAVVRASTIDTPASTLTPQGAAIDAARTMIEDLKFNLERAGQSGTQSSTYAWEADGLTASASVKDGMAITGMAYETFETIDDVAVVMESTMDSNVQVCPDADGRVMGQFKIIATLHHSDASGKPLMTRVTMQVGLDALVGDDAWVTQVEGDFLAEIERGTPTPAGEFEKVLVTEQNSGTLSADYFSGTKGPTIGKVAVKNARGGGPLGAVGRDIAAKVQQGALKAIQDYWRTGNCVYAQVDASPQQIDRGGSSELTVIGFPMNGGGRIPVGTAEYTGVNQGTVQGIVSPGAAQPTPAEFTFTAAANDGLAAPEFKVTSKRGIGFGIGGIQVGQTGWAVDWTGENGERITGVKCDGIPGTWDLTGTSDYTWGGEAVMEIGEDLSGTITWNTSVTAHTRFDFNGTSAASFEARAGGYVVLVEGGELPVRKATSAECG